MKRLREKIGWIDILSMIGLLLTLFIIYFAWQGGIFESQEQFVDYVEGFGAFSIVAFLVLQIVQVFLPLLPSAIILTAGVVLYGPLMGVVYNYIGISIGAILGFLIIRRYGESALEIFVSKDKIEKNKDKLTNGKTFERILTAAVFIPFVPDNEIGHVAGLSDISIKKFVLITLLGRPISIAVYSLGVTTILEWIGII